MAAGEILNGKHDNGTQSVEEEKSNCTKAPTDQGGDVQVALPAPDWTGGTLLWMPLLSHMVFVFVGKKGDVHKYMAMYGGNYPNVAAMLTTIKEEENLPAYKQTVWNGAYVDGPMSMILLPKLDLNNLDDIIALEHECLHVIYQLLLGSGWELGTKGEAIAYMQQYLVKSVITNIKSGFYFILKEDGTTVPARNISNAMRRKLLGLG